MLVLPAADLLSAHDASQFPYACALIIPNGSILAELPEGQTNNSAAQFFCLREFDYSLRRLLPLTVPVFPAVLRRVTLRAKPFPVKPVLRLVAVMVSVHRAFIASASRTVRRDPGRRPLIMR